MVSLTLTNKWLASLPRGKEWEKGLANRPLGQFLQQLFLQNLWAKNGFKRLCNKNEEEYETETICGLKSQIISYLTEKVCWPLEKSMERDFSIAQLYKNF